MASAGFTPLADSKRTSTCRTYVLQKGRDTVGDEPPLNGKGKREWQEGLQFLQPPAPVRYRRKFARGYDRRGCACLLWIKDVDGNS